MSIKPLDWEQTIGQKIRIYRNLNNGTMSIQRHLIRSWRVVGHVTHAVVRDVCLHLSESGRQRVIRDLRKNVHAWGEGILVAPDCPEIDAPIDLAYNPYQDATFVERGTKRPILKCRYLVVRDNRVFVSVDALGDTGNEGDRVIIAFAPKPVQQQLTLPLLQFAA
jgi:hypothetical protein